MEAVMKKDTKEKNQIIRIVSEILEGYRSFASAKTLRAADAQYCGQGYS